MIERAGDLSLLIVDDDSRILELAEYAARELGCFRPIRTAADGQDALTKLKAEPRLPNVILTDLSMPGMDGFEFIAALKRRDETKNIPVVMFSSSGLHYDEQRALAAGCEAFYPKPETMAGLSEVLAKVATIALGHIGAVPHSANPAEEASPGATATKGLLRPTKLLLVDDKPANLLALEAVLESPEYHLIRASSGAEALEQLRTHPDVALVLLDVQMPGMDGLETSRRIKELPGCQDIPIIFITAVFTEDPFVKQGYQAGAVDYFSKPFDPDILRLKVGIYAAFRQKAALLKDKERQLRESEELLRAGRKLAAILETVRVGVIITDAHGRVCQTNDEVLKMLKSVEQIRADSYGEFLAWWDGDGRLLKGREGPLMQTLLQGDVSHNEVVQLKCLDHTTKLVFASTSPLRGLDGHVVGAVLVMQDVTAQKEIEQDIEKRIYQLVSLGVEFEEVALRRN